VCNDCHDRHAGSECETQLTRADLNAPTAVSVARFGTLRRYLLFGLAAPMIAEGFDEAFRGPIILRVVIFFDRRSHADEGDREAGVCNNHAARRYFEFCNRRDFRTKCTPSSLISTPRCNSARRTASTVAARLPTSMRDTVEASTPASLASSADFNPARDHVALRFSANQPSPPSAPPRPGLPQLCQRSRTLQQMTFTAMYRLCT
jgi:hypothetical protein